MSLIYIPRSTGVYLGITVCPGVIARAFMVAFHATLSFSYSRAPIAPFGIRYMIRDMPKIPAGLPAVWPSPDFSDSKRQKYFYISMV